MCSCRVRPPSSTPTSTRSSPRSSSATTRAAREAGDRRGGRRARRAATRPRRRGVKTAMGGGTARSSCARRRSSSRRGWRPTRRRARRCSRCSRTPRRWSRGCRSTRRSSTCAGWSGSPARRRRSRARLRREVREEVGLPITVGVARTKFLAKVASGWRSPTGCSSCRPSGELAFLHPLPVEALWGVGPVTSARKLHARGIDDRRRRSPSSPRRRWSVLWASVAGAQLHALAHNRDPRPVDVGRRRRSIGAQRALGRRGARRLGALDAILVALVDRLTRRLRARRRVARTVIAADALRRLHARDPLAHPDRGDRRHDDDPRGLPRPARGRAAADRAPRPHDARHRAHQPRRRRARCSSRCRSSTAARARSTPPSTTSATRYGADCDHARACSLGRDTGSRCHCFQIEDRSLTAMAWRLSDPHREEHVHERSRPLHRRRPLLDRPLVHRP